MSDQPALSFSERMAKLRAERERKEAEAASATPVGLEDYTESKHVHYDPDPFVQYVKNLPGEVAIELFTRKTPKREPGAIKKDGNKFRCPQHDHEDKNPSAWWNRDTKLWKCGGCEAGGDWLDLAAAVRGYRSSTGWYDRKSDWVKLLDELKADLGWKDPEPEPLPVESVASRVESERSETEKKPTPVAVSTIHGKLDWRALLPLESFLRVYMEAVTIDDVPEEFHFGSALVALGMALGRTVTLRDGDPVHSNLYICVIGQSGTGKSRASKHLRTVLYEALPFDKTDLTNQGAKFISNPGSGEVLYEHFSRPVKDPYDDRKVAFYAEVRAVVAYAELAGLTGRSSRTGSTLKSSLIDLYDCPRDFSISSRTHGETIGENPFGSMLTSTQPDSIAKLMSSEDDKSGFLNRFIFLTGTPKERFALNEVTINLDEAIKKLKFVHDWGRTMFGTGGMVEWSPEAKDVWREFFKNTVAPDQSNSANDMLGRIDLLMKKFILLFAANKCEDVVSATTVQEALSLYQYFVESYGYTSSKISNTQATQAEDEVLTALDKAFQVQAKKLGVTALEPKDWPKARNVQQLVYPKRDAKATKATLDSLVAAGWVLAHELPRSYGGEKLKTYARNPDTA